ncbi:MAG TPA: M48 family metalloprotease [Acidimicrobiales bacterium]|nr:M48 family metalloprotease [Acidimicrobiales bacterium]
MQREVVRPLPVARPALGEDRWRIAVTSNKRRAVLLSLAPAILVAAIVVGATLASLPVAIGIVLAVLVVAFACLVWWRSSRAILRQLGSHLADEDHYARLYNLAEGLCLASGLPQPELRVIEDPAPNAISIGRSPAEAVVVCTSGLLDRLDRMELEAVLAHELAHVRTRDTLSGSVSAMTAGYLGIVAAAGHRLAVRGAGSAREALADQAAISLTRYPPALISALEKIAAAPTTRPASLSPALVRTTGHLWLAPLDDAAFERKAMRGRLDLADRVAVLREY